MGSEADKEKNWSEEVEDLVESGDIDSAISLLETLIPKLQSPNSHSQLASALFELANLYSSKGLSLKSDQARSQASAINLRFLSPRNSSLENGTYIKEEESCNSTRNNFPGSSSTRDESANHGDSDLCSVSSTENAAAPQVSSDDDWEAIVDRAPDELLSPQCLPEVSHLSLHETEVKKKVPNRRGRGTFTYKKQGLYSDEQGNDSVGLYTSDQIVHDTSANISEARNLYGTHHVLVLDGFHPSTTTTDLERLFEGFRDRGFAIRWVNDTLALAVFRTPSTAVEAQSSVRCSFKVRLLEKEDSVMQSISIKDLDPPRQRPKTSARTAQRLIAQELGVKLPSTFGSRELKKQEDDRRDRIISRQILKDEAWGPDDLK
ncbi:Coiled-coil domain-containing protein R3HCC1L [Bienertia sinuspersici]